MKNTLRYMFLGTGNALHNELGNFHSNLVIEYGSHRLFIDCGSDFPHALRAAGMTFEDVDNVYISHEHADHAGGLEWLAFIRLYGKAKRPIIYSAPDVWKKLYSMLSIPLTPSATLHQCFREKTNISFRVGPLLCRMIRTLHIDQGHGILMHSYGLLIQAGEKKILFTSDTTFNEALFKPYYAMADVILQDCSTGPTIYKAHAHFDQLKELPEKIKAKMLLYHYGPTDRPNALTNGFMGYAVPREWYEL